MKRCSEQKNFVVFSVVLYVGNGHEVKTQNK